MSSLVQSAGQDWLAKVSQAWTKVLDRQSFAADMPFDAAGGDSLGLLKLIFLLEEASKVSLPMELCRTDLRPSDFARLLEEVGRKKEAPVVSPTTVFLFPGMGGDSLLLGNFRSACTPEVNFITLDPPDWPEMIQARLDIDGLASQAARRICELSATGPLFMAGLSMGGSVAFTTALKLRECGRTVEFVGILDTDVTPPPADRKTEVRPVQRLYWKLTESLSAARRGNLSMALASGIVQEITRPGRGMLLRQAKWFRRVRLPSEFGYYLNRFMEEALHRRAHREWRAKTTTAARDGIPAVLFRSEQGGPQGNEDDALGWRPLCPEIRIIRVPGGHETMLRPPNLATLRACFVEEIGRIADRRDNYQ